MNFTRNEKKALKLILENARTSDSVIASKLNISSQAVGKIRRKLEDKLILSYAINLNYEKLGIHAFAIALANLTPKGIEAGEIAIEKKLLDEPHIIQAYKIPGGKMSYVMLYGFRDINELDSYFHSNHHRSNFHNFLENKEMHTFSHGSLLKNNPANLFNKILEESRS